MKNNSLVSKLPNGDKKNYTELLQKIGKGLKKDFPNFCDHYYSLPERVINYLLNNITTFPWLDKFIMYSIMMNDGGETPHILNRLIAVNSLFKWARKNGFSLDSEEDLTAIILKYKSKTGKRISEKVTACNSLLLHSNRFLDNFPNEVNKKLRIYMIPNFKTDSKTLYKIRAIEQGETKNKRRKQTDTLKKNLTDLVSIAQSRWNWMLELYRQIKEIKKQMKDSSLGLPYDITMPAFDNIGSLKFRVWNKANWINHHAENYSEYTLKHRISDDDLSSNVIFLQYIGKLPLNSWFLRAIEFGALQSGSYSKDSKTKNYCVEQNIPAAVYQSGINSGILNPNQKMSFFFVNTKEKIPFTNDDTSILFEAETLISAALIGYLAVLIISLTGMRISEVQQLNLENSIKQIYLPIYNEENDTWENDSKVAHIFEILTKGKTELQKAYVPEKIIEVIAIYMRIYREFHGEKLQPIDVCSSEKNFTLARHFVGKKRTWIFQWNGNHLSNSTINSCIYFILLEHNHLDKEGKPMRLSAHTFRHGFAGYLRQKGVPLERIAALLHQLNTEITEYYSQEPDEVILEHIYTLVNDIGGQLKIAPGVIRSIDDIKRFEEECLKRFGALRKVIGGKCGVYCSCEAMNMCARCEHYVPQEGCRGQIVDRINGELKVAKFYEKHGQYLLAERLKINARNWNIALLELDSWKNIKALEYDDLDKLLLGEIETDPNIKPTILSLPSETSSNDETHNLDMEDDTNDSDNIDESDED